jgi:uncharacterized protein YdhG (YjbR/CyaY superfamily)
MDISKMKFETIDEYTAAFPGAVGERLQTLRAVIKEEAPEAVETISYNIPTFVYHGNLIYFAAAKNHIGVYPYQAEMDAVIPEVVNYKAGKGTIQLPNDEPLPLPLIRQVVQFRVNQALAKIAKKKKK